MIKFMDGTPVPRKHKAKYLGAILTDTADNLAEIIMRKAETTDVCNKLKLFPTGNH